MKKKLLSLVLAGAMVASTSVSAFAADAEISKTPFEANGGNSHSVTETGADAEINIEGKIANGENKLPSSTINVTVPTIAKFTVDKAGKLVGTNINITSQSSDEVEVLAYKFYDLTGESDINVVDANTLKIENGKSSDGDSDIDRKKVSLRLQGNRGTVSLKTSNNSGICKLGTSVEITDDNEKVVGTVVNGRDLKLSLEGDAVTVGNPLTNSISDKFTLTLKLRKKA